MTTIEFYKQNMWFKYYKICIEREAVEFAYNGTDNVFVILNFK